jgi:hypothetical protein
MISANTTLAPREKTASSRRRRPARIVAMTMLAVGSVATVGITGTAPASATPAQCVNGANGFANTPGSVPDARTVASVDLGFGQGVRAELRVGTYAGGQRGWARLVGPYVGSDAYWMDWTTNGGASWIQCGPFTPNGNGGRNYTPGQRTNASTQWRFRACGRLIPPSLESRCTGWW